MASPLRRLGTYLELIYTFPVVVLVGAGGGYLLDRWLGSSPIATVSGFVLGLVSAFVYLIKMLNTINTDKNGKPDEHDD
jgi:F0F1-type ATP synthase assembly protein I